MGNAKIYEKCERLHEGLLLGQIPKYLLTQIFMKLRRASEALQVTLINPD